MKYIIDEKCLVPYNEPEPQNYPIYGQRDPKWGNDYIGNSKSKIKDYGCFLCSLSMMVRKEPPEVNKMLLEGGAYNNDLIISEKINKLICSAI